MLPFLQRQGPAQEPASARHRHRHNPLGCATNRRASTRIPVTFFFTSQARNHVFKICLNKFYTLGARESDKNTRKRDGTRTTVVPYGEILFPHYIQTRYQHRSGYTHCCCAEQFYSRDFECNRLIYHLSTQFSLQFVR